MSNTKHVLIVEDQPSLRMAIQRFLEADGYTVSTASDGVQALQLMEEKAPDIIVADIMMPNMNGYDFCNTVRARAEWTSIPFVFLTARAQREDVIKGKALGVEDYLVKPVDPEELLTTVRARLARAQAIQQSANEKLDEIKRRIITVLGHEMRTPLTHIRGYTDLALEGISSLPPELLEEFLQSIDQGADRLTHLADDLSMMARLDAGETGKRCRQLAKIHHDVGGIVTRTIRQYESQAMAKGVTLKSLVSPNLPPVSLYEPLLVDALGRLLDNAIKFSQGTGKQVAVSARQTQGWIEIAVNDEGPGIPPQEISHLFQRFQQINREKMEQQGIGLGLHIAQEVIHLHGGQITVTSTYSEGSTFTIRLPLPRHEGSPGMERGRR